jgi:hypothetical protein
MTYCEVTWCFEKGWMHTWADPKPKTYFFIELSLSSDNCIIKIIKIMVAQILIVDAKRKVQALRLSMR